MEKEPENKKFNL